MDMMNNIVWKWNVRTASVEEALMRLNGAGGGYKEKRGKELSMRRWHHLISMNIGKGLMILYSPLDFSGIKHYNKRAAGAPGEAYGGK